MGVDFAAVERIKEKALKAQREKLRRGVVGAAVALHQDLSEGNPVDTGFSRGNWLPSVGSPRLGPKEKPKDFNDKSVPDAYAAFSDAGDGDALYITNNTEYIGKLNDDSGFVDAALARFKRNLKRMGAG